MLSHCKMIAFTKKRVRNHQFSHPLSVFCPSFSPGLHFLPDMILIKQWQKCPIEAFVLEHEIFPQIAQMDTDFYLRTRTKGRWPKGKAITRIKRIFSHRYTQIFLEQRIKPLIIFLQELSEIDHALGTSLSGKASHSAERWRFLALRRCSGTSWRSCKELSGIIILENIINEKFLKNFWPFLLNNVSSMKILQT